MKGAVKEGPRKRKLQNTSLLRMKMSRSSKSSAQKTSFMAACKMKYESNKAHKNARFSKSVIYTEHNLTTQNISKQASFVKNRQYQQHQSCEPLRSRHDQAGRLESSAICRHCSCLVCKRKYFEFAQQQQWIEEQAKITNSCWDSEHQKQSMINYLPHEEPTVYLSTAQTDYDLIHAKQARLPTAAQNFHQPTAFDNSFRQQSARFHPEKVSVQQNNAANRLTSDHYFDPLLKINPNFLNRFFPVHQRQRHEPVLPSNSLTSSVKSVGSDTSDVVTSQHFSHTLNVIRTKFLYVILSIVFSKVVCIKCILLVM